MTADSEKSLDALLQKISTRRLERRLFRSVPFLAYDAGIPPSFLYISGQPNRCNPMGVRCLYFSENESTADAEYRFAWKRMPGEHQPKLSFRAAAKFRNVLDLEDSDVRQALGLDSEDLFGSWRLKPAPTLLQQIGAAIDRQKRIVALRYPSAVTRKIGKVGWNLAIFPSALVAPDCLRILGESEIPLEVLP